LAAEHPLVAYSVAATEQVCALEQTTKLRARRREMKREGLRMHDMMDEIIMLPFRFT
jgi:hypothetical protein